MAVRGKSSVLLVGLVAASLLSAPLAGARQTCQDAGSHIRCETNGSVSIKAVPDDAGPSCRGDPAAASKRRHLELVVSARAG